MLRYLEQGGYWFTIPLTVLLVAIVGVALLATVQRLRHRPTRWVNTIFHLGLFAFFVGVLGFALGLYEMLGALEEIGRVSTAILAGGLKVAMIAPLYGLGLLVLASILWFVVTLLPASKPLEPPPPLPPFASERMAPSELSSPPPSSEDRLSFH